eukprot:GHVR01184320.1.p1 GENE.GHVR01184320.1~~GHVR01184320.1.p1  ORF type:complete len:160 (+),score=5.37 GHVR01184320.1:2015-2494(+)
MSLARGKYNYTPEQASCDSGLPNVVTASTASRYWSHVSHPHCGFLNGILGWDPISGQESINLKGTHKLKDKIQKGQNAVLRGIEKTDYTLHYGSENLEYALNIYCDNNIYLMCILNIYCDNNIYLMCIPRVSSFYLFINLRVIRRLLQQSSLYSEFRRR